MSTVIEWVKRMYIYIFSAVGLVLVIIGGVELVNLALKSWVFTKADTYYNYPGPKVVPEKGQTVQEPTQEELAQYQKDDLAARRQGQAANAIALMVIGAPLFLYHWRLARREM
jgi:hypothetical protein